MRKEPPSSKLLAFNLALWIMMYIVIQGKLVTFLENITGVSYRIFLVAEALVFFLFAIYTIRENIYYVLHGNRHKK